MILLVYVCALGNVAQLLYVPPNELLFQGSVFLGSQQTKLPFVGNASAGTYCTMPSAVVGQSNSVAYMSDEIVRDYVYMHYQKSLRRLECFLSLTSGNGPYDSRGTSMQVGLSDFVDDISIVVSFFFNCCTYIKLTIIT